MPADWFPSSGIYFAGLLGAARRSEGSGANTRITNRDGVAMRETYAGRLADNAASAVPFLPC
jgi:hypothetical protein